MSPRSDTPILFPAPRGGYIDLEKFRHREWAPALRAAGIQHRRVYDCRHTFAAWAIESGDVQLWYLAMKKSILGIAHLVVWALIRHRTRLKWLCG